MQYNAANNNIDWNLIPAATKNPYDLVWDAKKIYGCVCDEGYDGSDCSVRLCPVGDDPMTSGQLNEKQLFKCTATSGTFQLMYKGVTSNPISYAATSTQVRDILKPFLDVTVLYLAGSGGFCTADGSNVVSIEFLQEFGSVPPLVVQGQLARSVQIAVKGQSLNDGVKNHVSVTGTKESVPCSGRGTCDSLTGVCTCFTSYITSDGNGLAGSRGDCGATSGGITACPGKGLACSGHGVCSNSPQYKCLCAAGWTSGDCAERTCPSGKAWFDTPIGPQRGHQLAECSRMGICDRTKGECTCSTNFIGGACERMVCPGATGTGVYCSGHGQCMSMAQLAINSDKHTNGDATAYTYGAIPNDPFRWDHDQAFGCKCDAGYMGYDCSLRECPRGDDPMTTKQLNEVQVLKCQGGSGSFRLSFRQAFTPPIAWNAAASAVKAELEALPTVLGTVTVTYTSGLAACTSVNTTSGNKIAVTFNGDFGDLPPLQADVTQLVNATAALGLEAQARAPAIVSLTPRTHFVPNALPAGSPAGGLYGMYVATANNGIVRVWANGVLADGVVSTYKGTKENIECSNRGVCDRLTGLCVCTTGYGSSNGQGGVGTRGDCGYVLPVVTLII